MKVAVITGGTKGIGRAISDRFLANNFKVYISARKIDKNYKHNNLVQYQADLSDKAGVQAFAAFVIQKESAIDILVNNVGVFIPGKLTEEPDGNFEIMINTNLASTYHLCRSLFSSLKKAKHSYIFNICSTASITPYLNGGSYCISKYAQYGLTKVLREELKEYNIRVSAVLPGATLTDSWAGTDLPKDRFIDPKSVAQVIYAAYELPGNIVMEEILMRPMDGDI
jgi:NAD(P)-dependent dehydrogenase (short-subunit alcohol dehydrogenase family)